MDNRQNHKVAGVLVRPPLLFLSAIVVTLITNWISPWPIFPEGKYVLLPAILLLLLGALLLGSCLSYFAQAETPVQTSQPTQMIVTKGPFGYSRNPIYIALFMIYSGLVFLFNSWWGILLLPLLYVIMLYGVIHREERYLEETFGETYINYKSRVRRWF